MLSMSRRVDGARWVADNSLKFRVNGVFVNGKMTVSQSPRYPRISDITHLLASGKHEIA